MGGILFFFLLLIIGVISLLSPETAWHLSEGWKFRDAEPSPTVLVYIRVMGVVELLAGVYILFTM